jgi:hypothetical protein
MLNSERHTCSACTSTWQGHDEGIDLSPSVDTESAQKREIMLRPYGPTRPSRLVACLEITMMMIASACVCLCGLYFSFGVITTGTCRTYCALSLSGVVPLPLTLVIGGLVLTWVPFLKLLLRLKCVSDTLFRPVSIEFHQSFMGIKCADVAPY